MTTTETIPRPAPHPQPRSGRCPARSPGPSTPWCRQTVDVETDPDARYWLTVAGVAAVGAPVRYPHMHPEAIVEWDHQLQRWIRRLR